MKIVISASGPTLDAPVDPRFGRCAYFIFADTDSSAFEAQQNASAMSGGGAGIQAAQFVVQSGAQAVVTGHVGPNAFQVLNAAGLPIYQVGAFTVQQAIDAFKAGQLGAVGGATGPAHAGMGMGMGMGRGMGMRSAAVPQAPPPEPVDDMVALKQEVAELRQAVAALLEKVDALAKK